MMYHHSTADAMFSRLAAMVNSDDPRNPEHRFLIGQRSESRAAYEG
jgi:hypothetical protein